MKKSDGQFGIFGKSDGQKSDGQIFTRIWKSKCRKINLTVISKKSDGQFGILRKSDGSEQKKNYADDTLIIYFVTGSEIILVAADGKVWGAINQFEKQSCKK